MLYDKRKYKEPRKDRSPVEIEYEKNKEQCSFKPTIFTQKYNANSNVNSTVTSPKNNS